MTNLLTAEQAYLAGREDMRAAVVAGQRIIDSGSIFPRGLHDVVTQALTQRWASRIQSGELPDPITGAGK